MPTWRKNGIYRIGLAIPRRTRPVTDFPRVEKIRRLIRDLCLRSGWFLDVGYCPDGFADSMVEQGWRCVGLDFWQQPSDQRIHGLRADVEEGLPFRSGIFDVVMAGEILEHLVDEKGFLKECHRVLRPQGTLIITTPNLGFGVSRLRVLCGRQPWAAEEYHLRLHTVSSLQMVLRHCDFKLVHLSATHLLYSRRRHPTGWLFELLADFFPTWGANLIVAARKEG